MGVWIGAGTVAVVLSACHESATRPPVESSKPVNEAVKLEQPEPPARPPEPIRIPVAEDDPSRWLFVQAVRDGEPGAWATGSFDPKRNKIDIHTNGARAFAIDTGRIPINWDRLVIIGIDGVNAELKKRDFQVYQFTRDQPGQWIVVEP